MRVLAIRGRNLASLAGDFAVDFEAEPLAEAGIFAITGPTGAGKSTLLDAMCLALFDSVPRLGAAPSRARIESGGDDLSASDPRALLRHGTGEGFAEIDFIGRDGERYRARWTVQRARQRAEGRLQAARHSLTHLDRDEQIGGTKTETLAEIHRLVGLSAEQFRRAVLLAQGDFEAFIRADDNERAVLLERLTGSHIYAGLGRAAYEKASTLRLRQQAILDRIEAQQGLDDEARAAAEAVRDTAQADAAVAQSTLATLDTAARWESDRAALVEKLAECEAVLARVGAAQEEAAPRREALRRRKAAFAFAAEWRAVGEAQTAAEAARASAISASTACDEAATRVSAAGDGHVRAAQGLEATTRDIAGQAPAIDQARTLDRQIVEADTSLAGIAVDRAQRAEALATCHATEAEAVTRLDNATAARDRHAQWLTAHTVLAPLALRESEVAADLAERAEVAQQLATLSTEASEAEAARTNAAEALAEARTADAAAATAHAEAEQSVAAAQAVLPDETALAMVEQQRDRLAALRPLLIDWRHQQGHADALAATVERLRGEQAAAQSRHAALTVDQAAIAAALPTLRLQLEEARRAGALAEAASGEAAERLRATLVKGEPCPVCGATAHALTAIDALLGAQLEQQRARIAELDRGLTERSREDASLTARLQAFGQQIERLATEIVRETSANDEARARAVAAGTALSAGASAADLDAANPSFEGHLDGALARLDAERRAMAEAQSALSRARANEQRARTTRDGARTNLARIAEAEREAAGRLANFAERTTHLTGTQVRLSRAIDAAIGEAAEWRTLPDPQRWLSEQAGAWRIRSADHAAMLAALPALDRATGDARTATAAASARAEGIEAQATGWEASRARLATERRGLLGGEAVDAVVTRNEAVLARARQSNDAAQAVLAQARQDQAAATAAAHAAGESARKSAEDHVARHRDLRARLAALSLEVEAVAEAAREGQPAIELEEASLAHLNGAVTEAAALLAQRRTDLTQHDEGERPALSGEVLAEALDAARVAATAAGAALTEAQFALRRDDEVRAQTATLRADLERERSASHVWLQLAELIGDASGARFRRFAQGLTLDRLLAHANGRLADLKPRYALERGQGGDMLIQVVDHDMAGEVRGVHNLSGGERFLISLALALGLAEMSTGRGLRIESLFIDEGFGALDTASLGQAIAVLEHLHASGRRVGVISHVEEVKERIPVKIEVTPVARGRSVLNVVAG